MGTKSSLDTLDSCNNLRISWAPGHEEVDGNEEADVIRSNPIWKKWERDYLGSNFDIGLIKFVLNSGYSSVLIYINFVRGRLIDLIVTYICRTSLVELNCGCVAPKEFCTLFDVLYCWITFWTPGIQVEVCSYIIDFVSQIRFQK